MSATSVVVRSMNAAKHPGVGEALHRSPARARRVENQAIKITLETPRDPLHRGRRDAEHGHADGGPREAPSRLPRLRRRACRDHAGERMRSIAEHLLRDQVHALNVGHRIHHHDVGGADVGRDLARGDGRNHHLRNAKGQAPHARGRERGAARTTRRDDAADSTFAIDPARECLGHRRDRSPAISAEDRRRAVRVHRSDLPRRHIGARRLAGRREVDRARRDAMGAQPIADVAQFVPLGVKSADDKRRPADRSANGRGNSERVSGG